MKKIVIAIIIILICLLLYFIVVPTFIKQSNESLINNVDNEKVLSQQEVNAFNMLFLTYEGTQKGSMLNSLISNVLSSNSEYAGEREISITFLGKNYKSSTELKSLESLIETQLTYNVNFEYDTNGIINNIQIVEQ